MSPIDSILGIDGLVIELGERGQNIHVWANPVRLLTCLYCPRSSPRIKATYQLIVKHSRPGDQLVILHLKIPKHYCLDCNRYFRHRFDGIRPRARSTDG